MQTQIGVASPMLYDMDTMTPRDRYRLLTGTVVPRPIGWISTVDTEGRRNLAPYSFFQVVAATPPTLMFVGGRRDGATKDSVENALRVGSFVAHVTTVPFLDAMNATSLEAPRDVDEFAVAGLEALASERVPAPRVAGAPVAFECETVHHWEVSPGGSIAVFGRIVVAHVADEVLTDGGRVDVRALMPLARLSGPSYGTLGDLLERERPG